VQAIVYRGPVSTTGLCRCCEALYASHYFETALDLTVLRARPGGSDRGFYLITLKGSQQAGLTGLKGGIVRKVAVDKTRSFARTGPRSDQAKVGKPDGLIRPPVGFMVFPDRKTASALLTILLFAVVLAVVYVARTVIVIFAFSILFAYLINPIVRFLQRHSLFFKNLARPARLGSLSRFDHLHRGLLSHGLFPEFRKERGPASRVNSQPRYFRGLLAISPRRPRSVRVGN